ncbi:glycosyl transferase family, a/b domain-containing protein [Gorgonomyces haynaldii]|nr:glycosyl transferase family, a/b domain-containing protein [Gorgonomyces haynaldii]
MLREFLTRPESQTPQVVRQITADIMDNKLSQAQIGAFLIAIKYLGLESDPKTVAAVADAMRNAAVPVPSLPEGLCDIVGTGGDGQNTFNVSTAASIVAAGAGCRVAKHGNRASSSSSGSADVLEAMGCKLQQFTPNKLKPLFDQSNFCFLFAQMYHPAMKFVSGPRRELGVRTIFNLLGPLTNPAKPKRMVVGVFAKQVGAIMAQALYLSGVERAWVVHGALGLDEISPEGKTIVWDLTSDGTIQEKEISPSDFGLQEHPLESVRGGDANHNAQLMQQLLSSQLQGPILDFVLLNSAALLFVNGKANDLKEGVRLARESISSGKALQQLEIFKTVSET